MKGRSEPCPTTRDGFTLIEIIGALLIFSVGVIMALQLSGSLATQIESAALRTEVVWLARDGLDSLETVVPDSLTTGTRGDTLVVRGRSYARTFTVALYSPLVHQLTVDLSPVTGSGPRHTARSFVSSPW
ncbi:MAG TPA: prepilin-type N-terminal cleavage/methylation domain-containing protein [Longimicrobiales bacterium]